MRQLPGARLVLAGVANALDLTERALPALAGLGARPALLPFPAYDAGQLQALLGQRLSRLPGPVYAPQALRLCAKKARPRPPRRLDRRQEHAWLAEAHDVAHWHAHGPARSAVSALHEGSRWGGADEAGLMRRCSAIACELPRRASGDRGDGRLPRSVGARAARADRAQPRGAGGGAQRRHACCAGGLQRRARRARTRRGGAARGGAAGRGAAGGGAGGGRGGAGAGGRAGRRRGRARPPAGQPRRHGRRARRRPRRRVPSAGVVLGLPSAAVHVDVQSWNDYVTWLVLPRVGASWHRGMHLGSRAL